MKRRTFVRVTGLAGAGLVVGFTVPGCSPRDEEEAVDLADRPLPGGPTFEPNGWVTVHTDGTVTVMIDEMEMGQAVTTSVPMIVADEVDVPWEAVRWEYGPTDPSSWARGISTGGSTSIRRGWEPFREAGGAARTLLMTAAAARWGLEGGWHAVSTEPGYVVNPATGDRIAYGELVEEAGALPVPEEILLKSPDDFRIIGTPRPRVDTREKVDGSKVYGMDVAVEGMGVAVIARPPVLGGRVRSFDDTAAREVPGVRDVVEVEAGVAVVADDTWAAMKGRDALEAEWDDGPMGGLSDADVEAELERRIRGSEAAVAREDGNAGSGLAGAATRVEAVYDVPYLAHACMEPLNCMAHVRDDGAEIRVPTQNATATQQVAAEITGLDPSSIVVHSLPMGGGFGRRSNTDFVREAVELSQAVGGPVKVIWSREDDTRGGYYRPVARHRLEAGLDADGRPVAWRHRVAAPSLLEQLRPGYLEQEGVDGDAVAGARELPYAIPHLRVEYAPAELPVSLWWWRSVGHSHNGFVTEGFVDELAAAAGEDPVEFRRRLLADHPRHLAVLDLAADRAGWGSSLPEGRARGVSVHASFGSWAAHVVEVSLEEGRPRVHRVVAAIDCGQAIHPDTIEAQTEGAIAYGLSAALHEKVSLEDGRVVEGNFGNYPILRMREMPRVETHRIESTEEPGGIGELNTPPIAAAVTNALFALTGRRIRRLPIGDQLADLQA